MHTCILCIGSNFDREKNLPYARKRLEDLFSVIYFADEEVTKPLYLKNQALFTNQVAKIITDMDEDAVYAHLKMIENEAGRHPEDKGYEKILLDIDLLMYDDHILKPDEMKRDYIIRGIFKLS